MQANELRIGNLINYKIIDELDKRKSWYEVSEVDYDDLRILGIKHEMNEDYQPIPLTEEWLLKFGFIQDTGEPERFFNDIISLNKYKNAWTVEYNNNDFVFEYVHELQNLHFILKREELKI